MRVHYLGWFGLVWFGSTLLYSTTHWPRMTKSYNTESVGLGGLHRICALVESRGAASEIGFAMLDLETVECSIGQFADTPTYSGLCRLLLMYEPELVLESSTILKRQILH